MNPIDYEYLQRLLKQRSGLALAKDKQYLVESRLLPLARRIGTDSVSGLVRRLRHSSDDALATQVVDAMATNETFFFRDKVPFEQFRDFVIPQLLRVHAARRRIRIWCAACSTGQESYSLAMALKEMGDALAGWRVEVIATDLSRDVVERAKAGLYSQFEVQRGLPIQMLIKYFNQAGDMWEISPVIRGMVRHHVLNMLSDFSQLGPFDVVFCRNLLIYLDHETKIDILDRLAAVTGPEGFLVLGAAETVVGLSGAWKPHRCHRGLFQPDRQSHAPQLRVVNGRG